MNAITQKLLAKKAETEAKEAASTEPAAPQDTKDAEEEADVQDSSIETAPEADPADPQDFPQIEVAPGEFTGTYAAGFVHQVICKNGKKLKPVNGIFTPSNDDEKARLEHLVNTGRVTRIYADKE